MTVMIYIGFHGEHGIVGGNADCISLCSFFIAFGGFSIWVFFSFSFTLKFFLIPHILLSLRPVCVASHV